MCACVRAHACMRVCVVERGAGVDVMGDGILCAMCVYVLWEGRKERVGGLHLEP